MSGSGVAAIYFSLPWNERLLFSISFKFPKIRQISWRFSVPLGSISTKAHFWELSKKEKKIGDKRLITFDNLKDIFLKNRYSLKRLKKNSTIQYLEAKKF
jgi:hypothetical protein